jgi:hypothetical protein
LNRLRIATAAKSSAFWNGLEGEKVSSVQRLCLHVVQTDLVAYWVSVVRCGSRRDGKHKIQDKDMHHNCGPEILLDGFGSIQSLCTIDVCCALFPGWILSLVALVPAI